jgi:hypothetical protein
MLNLMRQANDAKQVCKYKQGTWKRMQGLNRQQAKAKLNTSGKG